MRILSTKSVAACVLLGLCARAAGAGEPRPCLTMSIEKRGTTSYSLAKPRGGFGGLWRQIRGQSFTMETRLTWRIAGGPGIYTRARYGFLVEDTGNGIAYFVGPGQGTGPDYAKRVDSAGYTRMDKGRQNRGWSSRTGLPHVYKSRAYERKGEWRTAYLRLEYDARTRTFRYATSSNGKDWRDRFSWQEQRPAFNPTRVGLSMTCTWDADPKRPLVQSADCLRLSVKGDERVEDDFTDPSRTLRLWRLRRAG